MTPSRVGRSALALVVLRLIGCSNPAGPSVDDVLTEQARWSAEAVTAYLPARRMRAGQSSPHISDPPPERADHLPPRS